ncbi:MAG: hypothetical protein VKO44_03325 [Cyanobacteriota bacterium]|jgi:hypothetical protein|nr:hypothetical protein [Cyanobacteriota bacterium]
MSRTLRWVLGLLLVAGLLIGAFLFLPFRSWLPGGTVADVSTRAVVNGPAFNPLFPKPQAGEQLIFTQEKRGFSQARLKEGDTTKALLSISDVITSPSTRAKFSGATQELQSWPLVDQGSQASALLVADRFQVKVIGQGAGLTPDDRHDLINAFDLKGLAALKPGAASSPRAIPAGKGAPLKLPLPQRQRQAAQPAPAAKSAVLEPAA